MVKNRKLLIEIGTDIAQREADVEIPEKLCAFFRQNLIDVKITPNYQGHQQVMLFSDRLKGEKAFNDWCKENPSGYQVENCASSVFVWLTSTPEGKETLQKLCQEL